MSQSLPSAKIKADMHMHTSYSDGKFTPEKLVELVKKAGLKLMAITDHDNTSAIQEAKDAASKSGIEVIPGVEFSADLNGREVHVLAYFIDYENEHLAKHLQMLRSLRIERIKDMIAKLNMMGSRLEISKVAGQYGENISLGRPHLAKALVEENFAKSYADAFIRFIGDNKPAYIKKPNPEIKSVLELISSLGGLSFIAHPGRTLTEEELNKLIELGIDGIEIIHPSHSSSETKHYTKVAAEHFLLTSGGSDFHGINTIDYDNLGKFVIPGELVTNMKRRL